MPRSPKLCEPWCPMRDGKDWCDCGRRGHRWTVPVTGESHATIARIAARRGVSLGAALEVVMRIDELETP